MSRRSTKWFGATLLVAVLLAGCSTAGDDDSSSSETSAKTSDTARTASATGVTADSIKMGFSYIDLEKLAASGIIKIDHGPYEEIVRSLVDDVNANGGVNGRTLDLVTAKYSPIGNTEQLAACTKLTEDDKVFAALNGLLNENNLCIVQQHGTVLVNGNGITAARLTKARAPWATSGASSERAINALVKVLDENGELEGHKIGVYAAQSGNEGNIDIAVKALEKAGYKATETAFMDAPENDTQAASAQDKVIAERMKNAGVDTLLDVALYIPGADFDAAGFHPRIFTTEAGNIAAAAFTNPLGSFPFVGGLSATASTQQVFDNPPFEHCREVYEKASGKKIKTPEQEDLDGKSSGFTALQIACTDLQIFVAAAKAAGTNLTNDSFGKGLASLGTINLANTPKASFGPDKPDGQDSFQLVKFDATWKERSGKPQFTALGKPVTLGS